MKLTEATFMRPMLLLILPSVQPRGPAHPKHQSAILDARRRGAQEKELVVVLEERLITDQTIAIIIGAAIGAVGPVAICLLTLIRDNQTEEMKKKQTWLESRKLAYYRFIVVFSSPLIGEDTTDYLRASLDAATYGNVILSDPFEIKQTPITFPINSLDDLSSALAFMRSSHAAEGSFEDLRQKALTPFLNEFMNRLRQNEY